MGVSLSVISSIFDSQVQLRECWTILNEEIGNTYVGVLESGELLFIRKEVSSESADIFESRSTDVLTARIFWEAPIIERWHFTFNGSSSRYYFNLPADIALSWKRYTDLSVGALNTKQRKFARFFLYSKRRRRTIILFLLRW